MKDKIFGVLQRVGRSFMLPIALLPVAGLLLGIGSSFTNETMLAAYGLNSVIHPGTLIYTILDVMSQTGNAVFNNLALLFAMGVAIGMARKEKEVAALSGAVAYIIMNTAIQAMINAAGGVEAMPANSTTTMLGITTLQMGVFGGIVVGLGVAALHNKFYKIELPQVLAFFGGTRFVPIISSIVYLVVGIAMFYIWPVVQSGIAALGALVLASGYAGTFIYGLLERALIPFGLHHVFYMPFWQTAVGGTAIIDGVTVTGAQNIFFAELASKSTTVFSVSATRFMAGKFPFMMFGLPGAALAMYQCAKPEKKKVAGGLLLSAALTAFLTGITEPLEFTFIFVALPMYAVHCVHGQCHKDKSKFQRLGDAGEESRQRSRQQQAACNLFLFRLGALVHRQRRAGQTEHHKGELTGHETGSADREHSGGLGSQLGKEDVLCAGHGDAIDDGGAAHSGLPERHIEHMMQSKGDQRTLQQAVNKGTCVAGSQHQCTQCGNTALHHRPDIEHGNADHQIHDGADDGHKACAAKEGQHLRQLDLIELVVQRRHAQTDHDAAEHTHLQGRDAQHGGGGVGRHRFYAACRIDHGLNGCIHNDIGHCTGQCRDLFFLASHADGYTHGKQQRQIVEHRIAGLAHHVQNGINEGARMDDAVQAISRQHRFVGERAADAQQQARHRQQCNG